MLMNFKLMTLTLFSILTATAHANPIAQNGGLIHFTGELVSPSCSVSTDTSNQTVALGRVGTNILTHVGDKSHPVPFSVKLVDCDPTVLPTAAVGFYGQTVKDHPNLLVVSSDGSDAASAQNVGLEISDSENNILNFGSQFTAPKTLNKGTNVFNFTASYVATGVAKPGLANGSAILVIRYE